jgi:hypothetical protein
MTDDAAKLSPATPEDVESVAFALLFSGRKRVHDSDRMTPRLPRSVSSSILAAADSS